MNVSGLRYDPSDCRVSVRAGHSILHVTLWHPNWGSAKTAALRSSLFGGQGAAEGSEPDPQAARQMLDAALGADATATWLGQVEVTDICPTDAVTMDGLRERIADMEAEAIDPDGAPVWTQIRFGHEADPEDRPGNARVIVPLSPAVAPSCDRHAVVTLSIDEIAASDLTGAQIDDLVVGIEDALDATVKENGAGQLVAVVVESRDGAGVVSLHMYLDSSVPGVGDAQDSGDRSVLNTLRAVASTWDLGDATFDDELDPSWDAVAGLRV